MKFMLDENLGIKVHKFILDAGYECVRASSVLGRGASDSAVYHYCLSHGYSLITRDHHFLNSVRFPPGKGFGIIFIRHGHLKTSDEIQLIQNLFISLKSEDPNGKLVILSQSGISCLPVRQSEL